MGDDHDWFTGVNAWNLGTTPSAKRSNGALNRSARIWFSGFLRFLFWAPARVNPIGTSSQSTGIPPSALVPLPSLAGAAGCSRWRRPCRTPGALEFIIVNTNKQKARKQYCSRAFFAQLKTELLTNHQLFGNQSFFGDHVHQVDARSEA